LKGISHYFSLIVILFGAFEVVIQHGSGPCMGRSRLATPIPELFAVKRGGASQNRPRRKCHIDGRGTPRPEFYRFHKSQADIRFVRIFAAPGI
tara:strand:- start:716 stop:994 length:279 start_codon:yes stop_codon:yes gene_type:complete